MKALWRICKSPMSEEKAEAGLMSGRLNSLPSPSTGLFWACCAHLSTFLSYLDTAEVPSIIINSPWIVCKPDFISGKFTFSSCSSKSSAHFSVLCVVQSFQCLCGQEWWQMWPSVATSGTWCGVQLAFYWSDWGMDNVEMIWAAPGTVRRFLRHRNVLANKYGKGQEAITMNSCNSTWIFSYLRDKKYSDTMKQMWYYYINLGNVKTVQDFWVDSLKCFMVLKTQNTYWKTHLETAYSILLWTMFLLGVQGDFCEVFIQYCRKNYSLEQKPKERNTKELLVWQ